MSTSVPAITFGPAGLAAPAESDVLTGRFADINAAFGGALTYAPEYPEGQLASSDAAIIGDANDQLLWLANQFDPAVASGRYQDALYNIYFLTRIPGEPTTVSVVCTGGANVTIPVGQPLVAADGNTYLCTQAGTIPPSGGSITLPFACSALGAIACPPQTFTIARQLNGFDTAISTAAGVLGSLVESRAAFYARYQQSVALNAVSMTQAIQAAVLAVPGVIDAYTIDNPTAGTVTVGGVGLPPYSTYICVAGGLATAVAQAIFLKRAPGSPFAGTSVTQTVQDTSNGYVTPYPSYTISWQTPASVPIYWVVNVVNGPSVPSNIQPIIASAIQLGFTGADGGPRARIGSELLALRYYGAIASANPALQIASIAIGQAANPTGTTTTLNINQIPTFSAANVTVNLV